MKQPLLSIVLPVYNTAKYLEQCIDSILSQTFEDFELLAIDDCSTDNSLQILRQYEQKDSRVQVLKNKNNEGLSMVRNLGISKAQGKYISFVDSDDFLDVSMYERMMHEAMANNAEIVVCGHNYVNDKGRLISKMYQKRRTLNALEATKEVLRDERICSFAWDKVFLTKLWGGAKVS